MLRGGILEGDSIMWGMSVDVRSGCPDLHAGLQVCTCSVYDCATVVNTQTHTQRQTDRQTDRQTEIQTDSF